MITLRFRYPKGHHRHALAPGWQTVTVGDAGMDVVLSSLWTRGLEVHPDDCPKPVRAVSAAPKPSGVLPGQLGLFGGGR